jgi:hypothetical protein
LLSTFIRRVLNFVECFSETIEVTVFFLIYLLMWYIKLSSFHLLNHPCITAINLLGSEFSFLVFC